MLKRYQVLLEDWQAEHLKLIAEKNDLSFSETLRIAVSHGLIHYGPFIYPKCKEKIIDNESLGNLAKEGYSANTTTQRKHQIISKLYFEARKTAECLNSELAKEI